MAMGVGCLRIKEAREAMRCLDKQITPPPVRKRQLLSPFRKPKITSLPLTLEIPSIYMKQTFFYGKFRHINGFVVYIVAIQAIT